MFHPKFQKLSSSNPSIPSQVWSVPLPPSAICHSCVLAAKHFLWKYFKAHTVSHATFFCLKKTLSCCPRSAPVLLKGKEEFLYFHIQSNSEQLSEIGFLRWWLTAYSCPHIHVFVGGWKGRQEEHGTCKLHTEKAQPKEGFEPRTFKLWCDSASATEPPCCCKAR